MNNWIPFSVVIPFYHDDENFRLFFPDNYKTIKHIHSENEIILIDDTGNSFVEHLKNENQYDVKLIIHEENKGFSQSVNEGVELAGNEVVFIFNSDLSLKDDSFQNVLSHFDDPEVFAVTLHSVYPDGSFREGAKTLITKSGLPKMKHSPKDFLPPDKKGRIPSAYPVGGHCAVRRSMYLQLQGMDGYTFEPFYWEDADLGFRAWKRGWKIVYEPKAIVIHPPEQSSIKNNFDKEYIHFIRWKNRIFFALKHYTSGWQQIKIRLGLFLRWLQWIPKKGFSQSWQETFGLIDEFKKKMSNRLY